MKPLHIGILSQSFITTQGVISLLEQDKEREIVCHPLTPENLTAQISMHDICAIVADPLHPLARQLATEQTNEETMNRVPVIALCCGLMPQSLASVYSATLSVYDTPEAIIQCIMNHAAECIPESSDTKNDLTPREKEIVVGIVKGLSNKEIAAEINVSVNTVMTHRRNIASKLQIHSPAGLTIYAIVSKLVSIDDIRHSIN